MLHFSKLLSILLSQLTISSNAKERQMSIEIVCWLKKNIIRDMLELLFKHCLRFSCMGKHVNTRKYKLTQITLYFYNGLIINSIWHVPL